MHNPAQRLGVLKGGAADIKAHPWFHGFDWDSFSQKKLKAPYVPVVRPRARPPAKLTTIRYQAPCS